MASTSRIKKRKFEEKKKTNIGRTFDTDLVTSESGGVPSSLCGSEEPCGISIQTRCSPTRFVSLCKKLKNEFQMAVREMGFSSLLEMSSCTIFRPLLGWLIESFNVEDASLCVHGKSFLLTPSSFEEVMGVKDGGEDFEQVAWSPDDAKRRQDAVRNGNATLSLTQLENNLIEAESVDDMFVSRLVLFTIGTLLMPTTSVCVGTSKVGSINGLESVRKKNWATESFTYLVDAIRNFKKKKGAFVGGCVLFLQVFYLHHLEGHNQYIDRSILPIAVWTEKKSKDVVSWIEDFGYGSNEIRMRGTAGDCHNCQSMHGDITDMKTEIKNCKLEIQELKNIVSRLQKSNREDVQLFESGQEGATGENGGNRSVRNHIMASDNCESGSGSQSRSAHSSDTRLDPDSIAMYKAFVSSGGYTVGPFELSRRLLYSDSEKIAIYLFDESLDQSEVVVKLESIELARDELQCLRPGDLVDWAVIDAYASLLTRVQIPENREFWFLPTSLQYWASDMGLEGLLGDMDEYDAQVVEWREYFGDLSKCKKIFIPSRIGTVVVDLRNKNVAFCYPVGFPQQIARQEEKTVIETLRILDHMLAEDIVTVFPNGLCLQSFKIIHKKFVQRTALDDVDIYGLKHMWATSKGMDGIPEFNTEEFRLELAIELVQSQFNEVSASVLAKCSSYFDSLVRQARMVESAPSLSFPRAN